MRRLIATLIILAVTACLPMPATQEPVGTERRSIAGVYTLDPQIRWTERTQDRFQIWTVNGWFLDQVRFVNGLVSGQTMLKPSGGRSYPAYSSSMTPGAVAEFVVDTLSAVGFLDVEGKNLRPVPFGSRQGYRFDLTLKSVKSLNMKGLVKGTVIDGELYLIIFIAAEQHYFPAYRHHVEAMFQSIEA